MEEKLKGILVDDEALARERLGDLLLETEMVDVHGSFANGDEALDYLKEHPGIDVAFLDIQMPGMSGLALADQIMDLSSGIQIVFVTGYDTYAVKAFELNAMDYVVKPFTMERLQNSLQRVRERKNNVPALLAGTGTGTGMEIRIVCFGGFEILKGGEFVRMKWRTQKTEELLALLITKRKPMSRDLILETLWPDHPLEKAMDMLNVTTYNLRKSMESIGLRDFIRTRKREIWMETEGFTCDLYEFDKLRQLQPGNGGGYSNGNSHGGGSMADQMGDLMADLKKALFLNVGDFLENKDYDWAFGLREAYRIEKARIAMKLYQHYMNLNQREAAADLLKNYLQEDPLQEELQETLISHYLKLGQIAEAKAQYARLEKSLAEELGVAPNGRIKALVGIES